MWRSSSRSPALQQLAHGDDVVVRAIALQHEQRVRHLPAHSACATNALCQGAAQVRPQVSTPRQFEFRQVPAAVPVCLCVCVGSPACDRETVQTCDSWGVPDSGDAPNLRGCGYYFTSIE